ncbi:MAG: response regulator [Myxococcota bacterium]
MRAKVMLIDDDKVTVTVLSAFLRKEGFEVVARTEAIGSAAAIVSEKPDIVVMDIDMPALKGDRIVSIVGDRPELKSVGFILHSSMPIKKLHEVRNSCQANGIAHKDGGHRGLLAEVDRVLKLLGTDRSRPSTRMDTTFPDNVS